MPNPITFGTDGWRAIIAEDFTFRNVRALAASTARYLKDTGMAARGVQSVQGAARRAAAPAASAPAAPRVAAKAPARKAAARKAPAKRSPAKKAARKTTG